MKCDDIFRGWINRSINEKDPFYKFMSAYVALNYLYGHDGSPRERDRAVECLLRLAKSKKWHPSEKMISEYLANPIIDSKTGCPTSVVKADDLQSIFNAIYQVRCNLFHGNKLLEDKRNEQLVTQGANVLLALLDGVDLSSW